MFWFFWIKLKEQGKFKSVLVIVIYFYGDVFWLVFFIWIILAMPFRPGLLRARFRSVAFGEPALCIPIAGYTKLLRLEIGIDGFGVKKHVTS